MIMHLPLGPTEVAVVVSPAKLRDPGGINSTILALHRVRPEAC